MWRSFLILWAATTLGLASPAWAARPHRVDFVWTSTDEHCVDAATVAATVEATLGRPVFHGEGLPIAKIVGHASRSSSDEYSVRLALVAVDGALLSERSITTKGSCKRLDESIAVVIALMIDSVEDRPSELTVPATPPRDHVAEDVAPLPTAMPSRLGVAFGLGGGASLGFLPDLTPFALFRGEAEWPGFPPLVLAMRAHGASEAHLGQAAGGTFDAWSGELSLCPSWRGLTLRFGLCLGAGAGAVTGAPVGLQAGRTRVRPIVFAVALPSAAVRIAGPFWLRAEGGAMVPILREPWGVDDASGRYVEVYRATVVAPVAALVIEVRSDP